MWCDDNGWGPVADGNGSRALTLCFCATALELPPALLFIASSVSGLLLLMTKPYVNPPKSPTFVLKLMLSAAALLCAVLVAVFQSPDSPANTTAQLVTALGWLLSIGMLVAGHLRAEPQRWRLRLWWLAQFCFSLVVFVNHSAMHLSSPGLRSIRGLALACVASLAALSLFPEDVPKYQSLTLGEDDEEASPPRAETPLLASSASEQAPMGASMLSQRTLYGASTNEYSAALSAWGSALRRMGSAGGKTGEGGQGGEAAGGGLQEGEGGDN